MNDALPTFRFRLKRLNKDPNVLQFDHWKIPLRLIIFITQTDRCDGLFNLQYCMIPEDCHIVLFDYKSNSASLVLDYGQDGKEKPIVKTPLEILEKSERLTIVEDSHPNNIVLFIKKLSDVCPPDITFVLVNITPDEETLEFIMSTRTLYIKHSMVDILEVMTTTLLEDQQKRLKRLVHDCCISLESIPEDDLIYSRCFATQIALQNCDFPLGLLFSYLVRIRIFALAPECPTSNDPHTDPYGYRLISLVYKVQKEFLEKAVYMVKNAFRMRIPSLPPIQKENDSPKLPEMYPGDAFETAHGYELFQYPKVIMADTNFISEFQIYCSTRHVQMPMYSDHPRTVPGENPVYSISVTTHGRTFQSPQVFPDKKTAKNEVTKLAMVELGLLRLTPKAFKVIQCLKSGEKVQLLYSPDALNELYKANIEKNLNELSPVSLLGEFCSKRSLAQPEYHAVSEEYGASAITFKVTATCMDYSTTSDSHPSKKMAKRVAAEKLLKILEPLYPEPQPSSELLALAAEPDSMSLFPTENQKVTPYAPVSPPSTESTSVDGFDNYTSALNNLCQKCSMQIPIYSYTEIPGLPTKFRATCIMTALKIEKQTEGAYATKKAAKCSAAELVYRACKELLAEASQ